MGDFNSSHGMSSSKERRPVGEKGANNAECSSVRLRSYSFKVHRPAFKESNTCAFTAGRALVFYKTRMNFAREDRAKLLHCLEKPTTWFSTICHQYTDVFPTKFSAYTEAI